MSRHLLFCQPYFFFFFFFMLNNDCRSSEVSWLSKCTHRTWAKILRDPCSYYGSASVPNGLRSSLHVTPLLKFLATGLAMMVNCRYSFLCCSWSVVMWSKFRRSVFRTELWRVVGHVITCLELLLNCQCSFKFWKKYSSEINIKKVQKQDLRM